MKCFLPCLAVTVQRLFAYLTTSYSHHQPVNKNMKLLQHRLFFWAPNPQALYYRTLQMALTPAAESKRPFCLSRHQMDI